MDANPKADPVKIRETYFQAVNGEQLLSDFILHPSEGDPVSVGEILENPEKWHGVRFADPLEPGYRNDHRIAFLNLRAAGRPYLFSNAHGGRKFTLLKQRAKIRVISGQRVHATETAIDVLVKGGQHYDRGGEIVIVTNEGQVIPRDEKGLLYDLDKAIFWEKFDGRKNVFAVCDCKPTIAAGIMAARGNWHMPFLLGVATAPTMDPRTGRIIEMDGYDAETGLMLCLKDPSFWPRVPDHPTIEQVKNAVDTVWTPFRDFPFEGPISCGVVMNAIITAAIRPLLPKAPAFAFDAPTPGSGKTLIATCLSEIAGEIPTVIPDTQDNEEIKKRILAILRAGKRVAILDNLTGAITAPALCGLLTSERYEDRVLGQTEMLSVPTTCLFILTGNNLTLRGDLCRRVLTARIDPKVEEPWKRRFDIDPASWCKEHRMEIIAAALTILRAAMREQGHLADRTASFEVWSDTARRAVVFIDDHELMDVSDPVLAIDNAFGLDPETSKLAALLVSCVDVFKGQPFKTAELISKATDAYDVGNGFTYTNLELNDAVGEIAGEGRTINARRLGRWIEKNRGRIVSGLKIEAVASRQGVKIWQVHD